MVILPNFYGCVDAERVGDYAHAHAHLKTVNSGNKYIINNLKGNTSNLSFYKLLTYWLFQHLFTAQKAIIHTRYR